MTLEQVCVGPPPLELPAVASIPAGARRGVVIIHEILGMQPEIERVVQRCAAQGYAGVAPDFFAGGARVACIARMAQAALTGEGPAMAQVRGARDWLASRAAIPVERIGVLGFCIGGGVALATGAMFGAVSTNYGDVPPTNVMRGTGPVIGCYGSKDRVFGNNAVKLKARLAPLSVDVETHTFPTVGHSFLTDGHHPVAAFFAAPLMAITWNPEVAEEAWSYIFRFLDARLAA